MAKVRGDGERIPPKIPVGAADTAGELPLLHSLYVFGMNWVVEIVS